MSGPMTGDAAMIHAAKSGDQAAFAALAEQHRGALTLYCYQILGTLQDAEDMVQEAFLRAWLRIASFDGRAAFRTWLYRIATNVCLDFLRQHRSKQEVALDLDAESWPASASDSGAARPAVDPFPTHLLPALDLNPEEAVVLRESVSLAFMHLLQRLPARQRVIVILRDVLNWRAREVAEFLDVSELAVNSALLRARAALQTAPGSAKSAAGRPSPAVHAALLSRYTQAWETHDLDALMAVLREDVVILMPPLPLAYQGKATIREFLLGAAFGPQQRWTIRPAAANDQPAFAFYQRQGEVDFRLAGLEVLTLDDEGVSRIDHYALGLTPFGPEPIDPPWLRHFGLAWELKE